MPKKKKILFKEEQFLDDTFKVPRLITLPTVYVSDIFATSSDIDSEHSSSDEDCCPYLTPLPKEPISMYDALNKGGIKWYREIKVDPDIIIISDDDTDSKVVPSENGEPAQKRMKRNYIEFYR